MNVAFTTVCITLPVLEQVLFYDTRTQRNTDIQTEIKILFCRVTEIMEYEVAIAAVVSTSK